MQTAIFSTGGAVIHKVTLGGSNCYFSVWTTPEGDYSDATRYDSRNRELNPTAAQVKALKKRAPSLHRLAYAREDS